ncbi:MAG: hypothetical protein ACKVS6_16585 [Planctomycetota bacterium]
MKEFEPTNRDEILDWLIFEAGPEGAEMLTHARKEMRRSARPLRGLLSKSIGLNRSLTIAQMAVDYSQALLKTIDPCDWIYYSRPVPELKIAKANLMETAENYKFIESAKKLQVLVRQRAASKTAVTDVIIKMLEIAVELEGEGRSADFQLGLTKNSSFAGHSTLSHWERLIRNSSSLRSRYAAIATYILVAIDSNEISYAVPFIAPLPRTLDPDIAAVFLCNTLSFAIATKDYSLVEHIMMSIHDVHFSEQILRHLKNFSQRRLENDTTSIKFQTLLQEKLLK